MIVKYENVSLEVREDSTHEWLLETSLVAEGYGVGESAILNHKMRKPDELIEGKHWVSQSVITLGGSQDKLFWTKKGVVRLGFSVKSEKAKKFRDWAEDLIVQKTEVAKPMSTLDFLQVALNQMKAHEDRLGAVETKMLEIEAKTATRPEYFTIMGFAILKGAKVGLSLAAQLGRKAKVICTQRGYQVDKITDPRFGQVGCYPKDVLEEVFG